MLTLIIQKLLFGYVRVSFLKKTAVHLLFFRQNYFALPDEMARQKKLQFTNYYYCHTFSPSCIRFKKGNSATATTTSVVALNKPLQRITTSAVPFVLLRRCHIQGIRLSSQPSSTPLPPHFKTHPHPPPHYPLRITAFCACSVGPIFWEH